MYILHMCTCYMCVCSVYMYISYVCVYVLYVCAYIIYLYCICICVYTYIYYCLPFSFIFLFHQLPFLKPHRLYDFTLTSGSICWLEIVFSHFGGRVDFLFCLTSQCEAQTPLLRALRWSPCVMCLFVVLGFPATGPWDPDPAGTDQQAVPPPGQREPHRLSMQPETHDPRRQPEMGQPAEARHLHLAQTQGLYYASSAA